VAPLPASTVPLGFLPGAATTVVPRMAPTAPPTAKDSPPPHTWSASLVAYVRREVGVGATGTRDTPGAPLRREAGAGAQVTCGAPGAALCREVRAGATGHVAPP
jgi:hypothetical protein